MRILHALSQRPSLTGSGITLDGLVRYGQEAGHDQRVVVGVPADGPEPSVGGLSGDRVHPLRFGDPPLDFPVPGMSDVMPYESSRFSTLTEDQLTVYGQAWAEHLTEIVNGFGPDVIHSHHVWLMSALLKDVAPEVPVVTHCHSTGLRQMDLCPHLADRVLRGCARNEAFAVLHRGHGEDLGRCLGIDKDRIHRVGAGYRSDLFRAPESPPDPALLYVGKYSAAKGVPWLLDVFERLAVKRPGLKLHVAGGGSGEEAEAIRKRMDAMAPDVVQHGQLAQSELAGIARSSTVCVLPSFFEGLPLVLVEALACGCRLVSTATSGVVEELVPRLGDTLELVDLPRLAAVDRPEAADLPDFVDRLELAIERALDSPPIGSPQESMAEALAHFSWMAVFSRVEAVWKSLI